jgi:tetratricopeptide (TPR) repeat protein
LIAKRATRVFPTSAQAYLAEGLIEGNLAYSTQAIEAFSRATQLDPDDPDASLGLAEAQFSAGQREQALETFEQGIKRFPQDAMHYEEYGIRLLQYAGAGHPEVETHAISLLQTALAMDSSLAEPHYQLGNLALKQGHPETALPQLEAAARLSPDADKVHYALARTYRRLGRSGDASREMALYQKLKAEAENPVAGEQQIYGMLKSDTDPPPLAHPAEANRE